MRPSGETVQLSARLGAIVLPGMGLATASWSAYRIMNGVTIPGVSAGSNQVGASEMWIAQVSCPSAATAGVMAANESRSKSSAAVKLLIASSSFVVWRRAPAARRSGYHARDLYREIGRRNLPRV